MNKKLKKINLITAASAIAVLSATSFAHADSASNPTSPPSDDKSTSGLGIVVAIQELGSKIQGLSQAGVRSVNEMAYSLDQSFWPSMQLNAKHTDIQDRIRAQTRENVDIAVKKDLQPFAAATLTYTSKTQPEVKLVLDRTKQRQDSVNRLKNLDASDSIYSLVQGIDSSIFWTRKNLGRPGVNDDAFNFASLIEPAAYTPEQLKNSDNFIGYATKQYQSYTDGLALNQLQQGLLEYQKQGVKVLSQKIDEFRNNSVYQNYQLTIRSMIANKSVATDILSGVAAERKPIMTTQADPQLETISRAIGVEPQIITVKTPEGQSVSMYRYASPLQIAQYRANYRLNDPKWYQEVAGDSAENLQRKSVIILAEINRQLFQNHLDNEKVMSALAILSQQTGDVSSMMLKTQTNDVNSTIKAFAQAAASSNTATDSDTTSTSSPPPSNTTQSIDPNDPSTYPPGYAPPSTTATSSGTATSATPGN